MRLYIGQEPIKLDENWEINIYLKYFKELQWNPVLTKFLGLYQSVVKLGFLWNKSLACFIIMHIPFSAKRETEVNVIDRHNLSIKK